MSSLSVKKDTALGRSVGRSFVGCMGADRSNCWPNNKFSPRSVLSNGRGVGIVVPKVFRLETLVGSGVLSAGKQSVSRGAGGSRAKGSAGMTSSRHPAVPLLGVPGTDRPRMPRSQMKTHVNCMARAACSLQSLWPPPQCMRRSENSSLKTAWAGKEARKSAYSQRSRCNLYVRK